MPPRALAVVVVAARWLPRAPRRTAMIIEQLLSAGVPLTAILLPES